VGDPALKQAVLPYLPGYLFDGRRLVSTGGAIQPTQHVDKQTGDIVYYVRPLFDGPTKIGMFVKHKGIVESLKGT
jgi:hypothetical protein